MRPFRDLLAIENDTALFDFRCAHTGLSVWPLIRSAFYRLLISESLFDVSLHSAGAANKTSGNSRKTAALTTAKALAHHLLTTPTRHTRHPVVVMPSGARLIRQPNGYFNALSDYFVAQCGPSTLVIEDLFQWQWPLPRAPLGSDAPFSPRVITQWPYHLKSLLAARRGHARHTAQATAMVLWLEQRAQQVLGWTLGDDNRQWLINILSRRMAALPVEYAQYDQLLQRCQPRLLIKEEACYGGVQNVALMAAAKANKVLTAEYQHGMITANHDAYNYGETFLAHPQLHVTLPDVLLTFGTWWGDQINAPVKKVAIGNPHRSAMMASHQAPTSGRPSTPRLLVLGDGVDTQMYLDFCASLVKCLAGKAHVVFRPHPLERARVQAISQEAWPQGLERDTHQDMYTSFQHATAVLGENTTGLFEAIGLVDTIFIWATPKALHSYPQHPFIEISSAPDLAEKLLHPVHHQHQESSSIWAPDWALRFQQFLEPLHL